MPPPPPPPPDAATDRIASLEQALQVQEELVLDLTATLATVQAEAAHEKYTVQQEAKHALDAAQQQVRRLQTEANLVQRQLQQQAQAQPKTFAPPPPPQASSSSSSFPTLGLSSSHNNKVPPASSPAASSKQEPFSSLSTVFNDNENNINDKDHHKTSKRTRKRNEEEEEEHERDDHTNRIPNKEPRRNELAHHLIQVLGNRFRTITATTKTPTTTTTNHHARLMHGLTQLQWQPDEYVVVVFLLQDFVEQQLQQQLDKDAKSSPLALLATCEWLLQALVASPRACRWIWQHANHHNNNHNHNDTASSTLPKPRSTTLRWKRNNATATTLGNLRHHQEWPMDARRRHGHLIQRVLADLGDLALLLLPGRTDAHTNSDNWHMARLALQIWQTVLSQVETSNIDTATGRKTDSPGVNWAIQHLGMTNDLRDQDYHAWDRKAVKNSFLLLLFRQAMESQLYSTAIATTTKASGSHRAPKRKTHRTVNLYNVDRSDSDRQQQVKERQKQLLSDLLPGNFLAHADRQEKEKSLMDWMALVVNVLRHLWRITCPSNRYEQWMTSHRARYFVAIVLDWLQLVWIPQPHLHSHALSQEVVLFLTDLLRDSDLGYSLLYAQMAAQPSSFVPRNALVRQEPRELTPSYSAIGVLSQVLSAIVQRQHERDYEVDGGLVELNPLRDAIIAFLDGVLRLTQFKLRRENATKDSPTYSISAMSNKPLPTFSILTSECQDVYVAAAAMLLLTHSHSLSQADHDLQLDPAVDQKKNRYGVQVSTSIRALLRLQLEELTMDEEEVC